MVGIHSFVRLFVYLNILWLRFTGYEGERDIWKQCET